MAIVLLAAMCWPAMYGKTPKEHFESAYGWYNMGDDFHDLYYTDEAAFDRSIDSVANEIKKYVYSEVLPTMDSTSMEYAATLMRLSPYIVYYYPEEDRQNLAQAKRIIAAKEGKSENYIWVLEQEIDTWNVSSYCEDVHNYSADSLDRVCALYEEMIECCHHVYRPSDSVYIAKVYELSNIQYHRKHWRTDVEPSDVMYLDMEFSAPFYIYFAGVLWGDLLKWDEVKEEEYRSICAGEYFPFYVYRFRDYNDYWDYISAASSFGNCEPAAALTVTRANATLEKRLHSANSEEFEKAADKYVEALYAACRYDSTGLTTPEYMEEAMQVSEEVLKTKRVINDRKIYDMWKLTYFQALLSAREPSKSELRKIEKYAKTVTAQTTDTVIGILYVELRAECALLQGDYNKAISFQKELLKRHLPLPEKETDEFYRTMQIVWPLYGGLARAYVLSGDVETAAKYTELQIELIEGWFNPSDKEGVAKEINNMSNFTLWEYLPYRRQLQKQFEARLKEWCECDWEEW